MQAVEDSEEPTVNTDQQRAVLAAKLEAKKVELNLSKSDQIVSDTVIEEVNTEVVVVDDVAIPSTVITEEETIVLDDPEVNGEPVEI